MQVAAGASLSFRDMKLTHTARAPNGNATGVSVFRILSLWPTITKDAGSTVRPLNTRNAGRPGPFFELGRDCTHATVGASAPTSHGALVPHHASSPGHLHQTGSRKPLLYTRQQGGAAHLLGSWPGAGSAARTPSVRPPSCEHCVRT